MYPVERGIRWSSYEGKVRVGCTIRCRDGDLYHASQFWNRSSRTVHRYRTSVCDSRTVSQCGIYGVFWMLMLRCFVKHRKICNLRQQTPSHQSDDSISQGEQSEQWAAITEIIIFSWPLVVPEFAPLCRMFRLTNGLAVSLLWSIHFSNSLKYFFNTWTGPRSLNAKSINGIDQVQIQQATFQDHFPQIQVYNNLLFLLHHNLE